MSRFTASISPGSVIGPQIVGVPEGKKSDSGEGAIFLIVFITTCHSVAHPQKLFCFARHVRPRACGRGTSLCLYSDLPWVFYRIAGKLQQLHSDFVRNGKVCTRNPPPF